VVAKVVAEAVVDLSHWWRKKKNLQRRERVGVTTK